MTDDIVNLSQKSGSGMMDSPETLLLQALRDVRDKEKNHAFAKGDKLLIIALDTDNDLSDSGYFFTLAEGEKFVTDTTDATMWFSGAGSVGGVLDAATLVPRSVVDVVVGLNTSGVGRVLHAAARTATAMKRMLIPLYRANRPMLQRYSG